MTLFKNLLLTLLLFGFNATVGKSQKTQKYDVVIYGGTSAGISSALQTARMNKTVLLIEPTNRIGGLTTGGLGQTDIGNKHVIGGISREFYENIKKHYDNPSNWKWQAKSEYKDGGQTQTKNGETAMWTFEPSAALEVYKKMINAEKNITLVLNERLDRRAGIKKKKGFITSIKMESGKWYTGKMFIDATYEGDLMALAEVSYTYGRESNDLYGENLNGVQANIKKESLSGLMSFNGYHHNYVDGVDPYNQKGKPESGLLPFIEKEKVLPDGTGDKRIQAYCFRMCLTDHPENRIPFEKPEAYSELDYELLFRNFEAGENPDRVPWINSQMPNRKTDTNNSRGFSTDFIGQNYDYPEASYEERDEIAARHLNYQKGLMWSLAYHPRIPAGIRAEASKWGMTKDEFVEGNGWQQQLYVREARRMVSDLVMTQKHCEGIDTAEKPIGMAAYGMDSHNVQRYVTSEGFARNEGNVEAHLKFPYQIGYGALVPKKEECKNLLVPVCLSASHISFGSIRMEPVFMVLGQSAATAAVLAINSKSSVQDVDYDSLKEVLLKEGQILKR